MHICWTQHPTPRERLWWSHMMKSLPYVEAAYRVTILIAPSPSNWPRWPSPARWSAPSSPRSADCERHRHAHDRDPRSTRTKRQESSARRAERRRRKARTQPLCGLNQAVPSSLRNRRHRSRRKTLVQWSDSGDLHVKRDATWGMSADKSGSLPLRRAKCSMKPITCFIDKENWIMTRRMVGVACLCTALAGPEFAG